MLTIPVKFNRVIDVTLLVGKMSSASFQNTLVQGDTGPRVLFKLLDSDGQILNVSGYSVNFYLKRTGESQHVNVGHEACSGYDVENGEVIYDFVSGDLNTPGTYFGDVQIDDLNGRRETGFEVVRFLVRESNK